MQTFQEKSIDDDNISSHSLISHLELGHQPLHDRLIDEDLLKSTYQSQRDVDKHCFLGVELKEGVQFSNGLSIFIVTIMGNLIVTFIYHSSNIVLQNQFQLNNYEDLVKISSMIFMISVVILALVSPFIGGVIDLFGRRKMMTALFISTGALSSLLPYSSIIWVDFTFIRIILAVQINSILNNTLIVDYVKNESIGKAVAYNNISRYIGNFMSPFVFLNLLAHTSIAITYNIMSVTMYLTGVFLLFSMSEPQKHQKLLNNTHGENDSQNISKNQTQNANFWSNIKGGIQECRSNPILIFCLMQNFVVRMGIVLGQNAYNLWVLANVSDKQKAFELLAFALSLSSLLIFLIQIPLIKLLDKIRPRILLIFAQLFRACSLFIPMFIDNKIPELIAASIVIMAIGNAIANVARDFIFQKNQGTQSRGVINGFMDMFQNIGILIYLSVFAFFVKAIGLNGCFAVLGICDLILLLISSKFDFSKR
ncbi:major facilitator superfamily mfs_1 [Stylonychia lemnae]|uniref:Major facilitator superfamily mfs_1 n=1 Tax=Stylonychia lemnae TaxID=5949 RepID=A0A078B7D7_STYLE|nr:major facilitator superfamily mfs_1 [Stylonychia lemnae]|eukprot:CDW89217.1 major facilitator superfamily mfs_1 [Stylonychia lemnae]